MKYWGRKLFSVFSGNFIYYTVGLYRRSAAENIFFLSAGIAFNILLCLVPLLLLLTSLIGIFIQSSIFPMHKIDEILNTAIPELPYTEQIKTTVRIVIQDIIHYRSALGLYGIALLIWASASMFNSVRFILNRIYKITSSKLVIVAIFENIILVIVLGLLFFAANFFSWIILVINSILKYIPGLDFINISQFLASFSTFLSTVIAMFMFFIMNRFIPDKGISNRVAFVSAFTTTLLWWIAGKGFGIYLTTFQPYSKLYGTYSFLIVFLVWIYYSSVVFIVGAITGELFRERSVTQ